MQAGIYALKTYIFSNFLFGLYVLVWDIDSFCESVLNLNIDSHQTYFEIGE